ncbi:PRD domain-containing protein [uncultured Bifidobacterium sp.]|uniref:PRD domain-containing protein n=1 Tax=uncultured Bifidobacterium sp. TaxID=165187 RepID=UPI00261162FD|nr:PRD domain-containing protein [uncultured Bifidobacterium sp.]
MEILRVFNNNVVLAMDDGREVILTGRGLGYHAKPGQTVDSTKIVRTFLPSDGRDPDHIAEHIADIPPELIRLVTTSMTRVGLSRQSRESPTLVVALADHVAGVLKRVSVGGVPIEYPLEAEVRALYPEEYDKARELVDDLNLSLKDTLPTTETVAFALHLVNAGFSTGDLSYTYTMTGVIQQMLSVIEQTYDVVLDQRSVNVARFITHLRYLFVRIHQGRQLEKGPEKIIDSIRESYPDQMRCAVRVSRVVELRLGSSLTEDEIGYLALHIARVVADASEAS